MSEGRRGKGSYGSVWAAVGPEQVVVAIKSFIDKQAALVEVVARSSLTPHPQCAAVAGRGGAVARGEGARGAETQALQRALR